MGLGLNWMGMNAGLQGYKDELRRQADDARRKAADEQAARERSYQDELRSRQRFEWSEADRVRNNSKRANADYWAQFEQQGAAAPDAPDVPPAAPAGAEPPPMAGAAKPSVPVDPSLAGAPPARAIGPAPLEPALAPVAKPAVPVDSSLAGAPQARALGAVATPVPSVTTAPAAPAAPAPGALGPASGIPKPRTMGSVLDMYAYSLDAAAKKGDVAPQAYLQTRALLDKMRGEGVTQAIEAFDRGDYAGGLAAYNSVGQHSGAKIVGTPIETTTTLPNGAVTPTHLVTLASPNGPPTVIDTAQIRYKMMGLEKQLDLMDKSAKGKSDADYKAGMLSVAQQNAKTTEQYRKDQAANSEDANLVRLLTGGGRAAKLDDKIVKDALELNAHLYSYMPDGADKDVAIAPAKSLYGNMIMRLGDPDKAYQVMAAIRAESVKSATDPATGQVDQAQFLKVFNSRVAAADARMRQRPAQAAARPAAAAPPAAQKAAAKAPAQPGPTGQPAAPAAAPSDDAMMEAWVNDKLMGMFDGPAKYQEIARTHPNPEVRKAAQRLYLKAKAQAAQAEPVASLAL